jgi:hypothetical protein
MANETIADIIAEMKREAAQIFPALPIAVLKLATRLEAAHDHDIAIATEASARAVVGACVKQQEAERKCVALREAMVEILEYIESFHKYIIPGKRKKLTTLFAVADTIRDKARAALAAPATTEKPSAVGNCAKLREALLKAIVLLKACDWPDDTPMQDVAEVIDEIEKASSAPPRNCDKYATDIEALDAYGDVPQEPIGKRIVEWLFAPAAEQEGGAK